MTAVRLNGVSAAERGLIPVDADQWLNAPTVRYGSLDLAGRAGLYGTAQDRVYEPRVLELKLATGSTGDYVTSRRMLDALYQDLVGLIEVEVVDAPDVVLYGVLESAEGGVFGKKLVSSNLEADLRIVCYDPLPYLRAPTAFAAPAGQRVSVPVGTWGGRLHYRVMGGTNPTVTMRDVTGAVVAQMRYTVALAAGEDYLAVDCGSVDGGITLYDAGVATDGFDLLHVDDTFFQLDYADAPTLECDVGALVGYCQQASLAA